MIIWFWRYSQVRQNVVPRVENIVSVMDRLAPEDVQAIVSGVVNNPQLVAGIAAQLKEAIQPPAPVVTPTVTDPPTAPLTDGTQQSGQQPPQQDPPLPLPQGLWNYIGNYSFFTQCFIHAQKSQDSWCKHCHSIEHTAIKCPYSSHGGKPNPEASPQEPKKGSICRDFNNANGKGCRWGANCYRRHVCSDCRGVHPRFKCPTKKTEPPSTSGRDARPNQQ